jgi:hypothetical protein
MCRLIDWQMFTDVSQQRTVCIYRVKEYSILKMYAVRERLPDYMVSHPTRQSSS